MPHLSLSDGHIDELPAHLDLEAHVALAHEEQLLALLQVVVLALVRAANEEHLKR